jgi:hypothetical protein
VVKRRIPVEFLPSVLRLGHPRVRNTKYPIFLETLKSRCRDLGHSEERFEVIELTLMHRNFEGGRRFERREWGCIWFSHSQLSDLATVKNYRLDVEKKYSPNYGGGSRSENFLCM